MVRRRSTGRVGNYRTSLVHSSFPDSSPLKCYALDSIVLKWNTLKVAWEVEFTDEFGEWWNKLGETEQIRIDAAIRMLEEYGPDSRTR